MGRYWNGAVPTTARPLGSGSGGTGQGSYTAGDILVAGTNGKLSKLNVGTNGQVFTVDTTNDQKTKWATPSNSGGGWTQIGSNVTGSGGDVTFSSIPQTFDTLRLLVRSPASVDSQQNLQLRVNGQTNGSFYYWWNKKPYIGGTEYNHASGGQPGYMLIQNCWSGVYLLPQYRTANTAFRQVFGDSFNFFNGVYGDGNSDVAAVSSLTLLNLYTGIVVSLWGI